MGDRLVHVMASDVEAERDVKRIGTGVVAENVQANADGAVLCCEGF